jgi:hypothetical protein
VSRKSSPPPTILSSENKIGAIPKLQRRLAELKAFDVTNVQQWGAPEVTRLTLAVDQTLTAIFGNESADYHRYNRVIHIGRQRSTHDGEDGRVDDYHLYLREDIDRTVAALETIIAGFIEDIEETHIPVVATGTPSEATRTPTARSLSCMATTRPRVTRWRAFFPRLGSNQSSCTSRRARVRR